MQSGIPKFRGQYFISSHFSPSRHMQLNKTLSKNQHRYADEISISIHPQNGFYKEGTLYYTPNDPKKRVAREFGIRKVPLISCFPVPVGPELETFNHFAKRLVQEARKMTRELGLKLPSPPGNPTLQRLANFA